MPAAHRTYEEMIAGVLKASERPLTASQVRDAVLEHEDVHRISLVSTTYWLGKTGRLRVETINGVKHFALPSS